MITAVGLVAGVLTTVCWIPQLVRVTRTRSLHDFSWAYLFVLTTGITLWLLYGLLRSDLAVIAANGVVLALLVALIALKRRFGVRVPADL